jgi:hypothetical protein
MDGDACNCRIVWGVIPGELRAALVSCHSVHKGLCNIVVFPCDHRPVGSKVLMSVMINLVRQKALQSNHLLSHNLRPDFYQGKLKFHTIHGCSRHICNSQVGLMKHEPNIISNWYIQQMFCNNLRVPVETEQMEGVSRSSIIQQMWEIPIAS